MVDSQPLQSSCRKPELPLIDYTAANAPDAFFESLKQYGFATLISHPLDMERVNRIYSAWRVHFSEGVPDEFAMDPVRQDGYFALDQAESAKGQQVRDHKEYFQFYRWGRCPGHLKHDLEAHFDDCLSFSTTLLRWVAEHLPPDIANRLSMPLESMIEDSAQTMLRVLHYPQYSPVLCCLEPRLTRTLIYSPFCRRLMDPVSSFSCLMVNGLRWLTVLVRWSSILGICCRRRQKGSYDLPPIVSPYLMRAKRRLVVCHYPCFCILDLRSPSLPATRRTLISESVCKSWVSFRAIQQLLTGEPN